MLVRSDLSRCVVYLGVARDGDFLPRATGFLVSIREHDLHFTHIVTAEHVVERLLNAGQNIFVRLTKRDGSLIAIGPIGIDHWTFHPNNATEPADVAIAPLGDAGEYYNIPIDFSHDNSLVCTPDVFDRFSIGLGSEIAIVGLFRSHYGRERSIPIVRIGHLAALRGEPVYTRCGYLDAYLVEALSIGGLSGSPVFLNVPIHSMNNGEFKFGAQTWLFGMMHGHFDITEWNADVDQGSSLGSINSGIGVVVPVEKITETIAHPHLARLRREVAENTPQENDPCFCGSGKTYICCHGSGPRVRGRSRQMKLSIDEIEAFFAPRMDDHDE